MRLRSGSFSLDEAAPLPLVQHAAAEGYLGEILHPLDRAVVDHPAVIVGAADEARLRQGQAICPCGPISPAAAGVVPWRAYGAGGELVALLTPAEGAGWWHGDKVFNPVI